tara:strand:- start:45 stop:560 length:516 start_codon:yes stop_codon:yes gene_type:complete
MNAIAEEVGTDTAKKKSVNTRKVGRPATNAVSRAIQEFRPEDRVPVGGHRDLLTVQNKDPVFNYRWVEDKSEEGHRIFAFLQGGYEFAKAADHKIGQIHVHTSKNNLIGSVIRVPSGDGFVYLMRIRRDWYIEDQAAKERERTDNETRITASDENEGEYGDGLSTESPRFR